MKKVVTVIGTRPQFIKMAMVSSALRPAGIKEIVIHTGQHYDKNLSGIFFKELGINRPRYNLGVGSAQRSLQIRRMASGIKKILISERPDLVLVYGDTNSTAAGALAASRLGLPVAHVEAGLRSFNGKMAEEKNRIIADSLAGLLFCPTKIAVDNLKKEGICRGVYLTGDVMYDSIKRKLRGLGPATEKTPYILCTIHRAENTDNIGNLREIFKGLGALEERVILPLHPRTSKYLGRYGIAAGSNIKIIKPTGYSKMLNLERYAKLIITDSGGVQKEAFILGIPCVTIRDNTEWLESVRNGMNLLAKAKEKDIISAVKKMYKVERRPMPRDTYGNGSAFEMIVKILSKYLRKPR
jgi:UDP-GlcNAc3NAcA epimerase